MQKVLIIGCSGSGKSTLARMLSERTGLPLVHLDQHYWQPGWVERSRTEKDRLTREVHARERWIFEGGHSRTWPERMARADTLIWLDVPLPKGRAKEAAYLIPPQPITKANWKQLITSGWFKRSEICNGEFKKFC